MNDNPHNFSEEDGKSPSEKTILKFMGQSLDDSYAILRRYSIERKDLHVMMAYHMMTYAKEMIEDIQTIDEDAAKMNCQQILDKMTALLDEEFAPAIDKFRKADEEDIMPHRSPTKFPNRKELRR